MKWKTSGALLVLLAALPLRAQPAPASSDEGPAAVDPTVVQAQADKLRDSVASPAVTNYAVHHQAAGMFENIQSQTPLVHVTPHYMDRETTTGDEAVIAGDQKNGMIDTAQIRYDHYRLTTHDVPATELANAMEYAKVMYANQRTGFDHSGKMTENLMGDFVYDLKDAADRGKIELNGRLALIATRIGAAFASTFLIHEAAHARAHAEGRVSPKHVIDDEVEAYRVQYEMLKILDPKAERTIVLISTLQLYLQLHPKDNLTRASIGVLKFQLELWDTDGKDRKLRELIKRLGYQEGEGVSPTATPLRA